jgi:hypothetical protein
LTSSQIARTAVFAVWLIAVLVLTSAQLRALASPTSRPRRHVVAWLVCTLVLGAFLSATDHVTGSIAASRKFADFSLAALISAISLGAGAWWSSRSAWSRLGNTTRLLTLALIHALVVLVTAYFFF